MVRGQQGLDSEMGKFPEIAAWVAMEREGIEWNISQTKTHLHFVWMLRGGLLGVEDEVSF